MDQSAGTRRTEQAVIRLCHAGLDSHTLRVAVLRRLRKTIPVDEAFCWLLRGVVAAGGPGRRHRARHAWPLRDGGISASAAPGGEALAADQSVSQERMRAATECQRGSSILSWATSGMISAWVW
jgi:hypothetical protein